MKWTIGADCEAHKQLQVLGVCSERTKEAKISQAKEVSRGEDPKNFVVASKLKTIDASLWTNTRDGTQVFDSETDAT